MQCRLCMQEKPLINAHIIPEPFFEVNNTWFVSFETPYPKKRPIGPYDPKILCAECDNIILGKLDGFAIEVLMQKKSIIQETVYHPLFPLKSLRYYRLEDKTGYDKLSRFFISVLWRASVSSLKDLSSFKLEKYEDIAKKVILEEAYDYTKNFGIALCFLSNLQKRTCFFDIKRKRIENINCYITTIGFYKVIIRCDKRKFPINFESTILSAQNDVLMLEDEFENMPEYNILLDMIKYLQSSKK